MADEGSESESRAEGRRPIELKVEYKRLNTFFADYIKNISRGGTFIKTSRPLPVGTEFLFKLIVPGREAPFTIHGEVHRIIDPRPSSASSGDGEGDDETGMAIRFTYREGDPQSEIARVVEGMMTESLGAKLYARLMEHAHKRRG
ncbi:MAG TPA: TIGR02266 family protein [Kofleriaceae bacterium]|nr:TIGR02266 family protein [Kofleriaceae bacterium]